MAKTLRQPLWLAQAEKGAISAGIPRFVRIRMLGYSCGSKGFCAAYHSSNSSPLTALT